VGNGSGTKPRRWKKAGGFGLLWGGLRSGDNWSCGLRTTSIKEEGGARVTWWPTAWGGGGQNWQLIGAAAAKSTVRERSRETVQDSDGGMASPLGHDSEEKGCKDMGDRTWPTATAVLSPPARGRAAVAHARPATGRHLSGA
jgi:hypothetical protein